MENGDEIIVEFYDGTTWQLMGSYLIDGTIYSNNTNYTLNSVSISAPTNLPANAQIRFYLNNNSYSFRILI